MSDVYVRSSAAVRVCVCWECRSMNLRAWRWRWKQLGGRCPLCEFRCRKVWDRRRFWRRCLKRDIARQIFRLLEPPKTT